MGKDKTTSKGGSSKSSDKKNTTDKKGKAKDDGDSKSGSGKLKAATSINCRHILCEKYSKKEEALTKLREGSKFDEVAREFSEDKARQAETFQTNAQGAGGSLGWKVRGSLEGDFEKVAYDLEPSTTGNPKYAEVKTKHGYHIIMVEGRK